MPENAEPATPEVVKTEPTTPDGWTEEFKVTKEQYEKLKEIENNKTIALKQEREEKQAMQSKLAEYEKAEQERIEKKKKEQWKFEELLAAKDTELTQLREKATAYDTLQAQLTEQKETELNTLLETIPTNLKEKYESITSKLDIEDKIAFYKNIMEDYKKEDFSQTPNKKGDEIDKKQQPKAGDIRSFISNAPIIQ